jgi:hypothetical protein
VTFLRAFGAFWYDFIIGDDWKIATYTVTSLGVVVMLGVNTTLADWAIAVVGTALVCVCFALGVVYDARNTSK